MFVQVMIIYIVCLGSDYLYCIHVCLGSDYLYYIHVCLGSDYLYLYSCLFR